MYHFIINSHAKSRLGHRIWNDIEGYLKTQKFEYKKYFTREAGHATQVAKQITSKGENAITIVVLGGDGTLNEVLNGLQYIDGVTLGYIPIGSSNDFARSMREEDSCFVLMQMLQMDI